MKDNFTIAGDASLADYLDAEAIHQIRCRDTDEHREAVLAFVEKRAPRFR
jgi:2-(1,2-epoxy-1,2-dihydrophenyl)acetyl-CoA isomerase